MRTLPKTARMVGVGLLAATPIVWAITQLIGLGFLAATPVVWSKGTDLCTGTNPGGKANCVAYSDSNTFAFKLANILSVSKSADMNFGSVVRPASGSGSIKLDASTGSCVVTRTSVNSLSSPTASCATFNISGGAANSAVTVTVTATSLTSGSNTLTLTPNNSSATTLNSSGALSVLVGGTVALANTSTSGTYTATVTLSAASN